MNYLAHLHIADHCGSDLVGNLLGDFVKGNPDDLFPSEVVKGIKLHRWVDSNTDSHPIVLSLKRFFPENLKRFAPIAFDMFWDHALATRWDEYHHLSLTQFINQSEYECSQCELILPEKYERVTKAMWEGEWLFSYQNFDNIAYALERMSMRRPKLSPLAQCSEIMEQEYDTFMAAFSQFYPDLLMKAKYSQT